MNDFRLIRYFTTACISLFIFIFFANICMANPHMEVEASIEIEGDIYEIISIPVPKTKGQPFGDGKQEYARQRLLVRTDERGRYSVVFLLEAAGLVNELKERGEIEFFEKLIHHKLVFYNARDVFDNYIFDTEDQVDEIKESDSRFVDPDLLPPGFEKVERPVKTKIPFPELPKSQKFTEIKVPEMPEATPLPPEIPMPEVPEPRECPDHLFPEVEPDPEPSKRPANTNACLDESKEIEILRNEMFKDSNGQLRLIIVNN
jgi:hypothetical protein